MAETQPVTHSHRKYTIAIIGVGISALLIGVFYGYATAPAAVTLVQGRVTLNARDPGTPYSIIFVNANTHNLTSTITNHIYLVYLPTGLSYTVTVQWLNMTSSQNPGIHSCNPTPGIFSPSGQNETQNFAC